MTKNDDISYEEEKDDEEMGILSSDKDTDLCTDQEPTNERSSLSVHKKKTLTKRKKTSSRRSKKFK